MFYYLNSKGLNETSAAFRIDGPDANTYLQGQFTQDLNQPSGSVNYGLFLNQKGKVVADGHILRIGSDQFWLVSASLGAAKLRERLEAYLIADEVTITDETEQWSRISLWGDGAATVVAQLIGVSPGLAGSWSEARGIRVFRGRRGVTDNFELMVPRGAVPGVETELSAMGASKADEVMAERERILSGIPSVPVDIGLNDLPNEGGLDEGAISYTKGCYLGQEVMARLKNLGQVRRRLHSLRGEGEPAASGAMLFQGDKKIGGIRSVARDGEGFVAMGMLSLVNFNGVRGMSLTPNGPENITVIRRV